MFTNPRTVETLATFFRLGRAPYMKGTVGTLGAIPLIFVFNLFGLYGYMALTFAFCVFALFVCDAYELQAQSHDSSEVVIDEVAGFLICMIWLPYTWQAFLYTFLLFRFVDIFKPWPIGVLDQRLKGGFGVLVDDLAAGVLVNLVMQFVYLKTNWLGEQWMP
jgi:phosphatidylglycerophosphatase A